MKSPLAIVTMAYNEPEFLPIWARHYRAQVGAEHCYLLDHGSDDGSVQAAGPLQVAKLPRSSLDEGWRAALVAQLCANLLQSYEAVIYTDVDELLVADPRRFTGLIDLSAKTEIDVLTAFGGNILHVDGEAPINLAQPITAQRAWTRPFSSLCKPLLIRRQVRWTVGFHYADAPSQFGGLYLFHIAYVDNHITARRQARRNQVPRSEGHGLHHGIEPDEMLRQMQACAALPRNQAATLGGESETRFITELMRHGRPAHGGQLIASEREAPMLWAMPPWLAGAF